MRGRAYVYGSHVTILNANGNVLTHDDACQRRSKLTCHYTAKLMVRDTRMLSHAVKDVLVDDIANTKMRVERSFMYKDAPPNEALIRPHQRTPMLQSTVVFSAHIKPDSLVVIGVPLERAEINTASNTLECMFNAHLAWNIPHTARVIPGSSVMTDKYPGLLESEDVVMILNDAAAHVEEIVTDRINRTLKQLEYIFK